MNNPNPFVPQGSLLEQKNKKRARVKLAVFSIFALNLLVITPLLIQGCTKKDNNGDQASNNNPTADNTPAPAPAPDTNPAPPALPPVGSNAVPSNTVAEPVPAPQPPPPPPAPPTPQAQDYVVTKGDTYYSIAKKFSIRMSDIKNANPNVNPAKLKVGQKLQIPAGGTGGTGATADSGNGDVYVVKAGDSLTKIAKSNGTSVKAIRAMNNMKTDRIKVGEKLKMPVKAAPADVTPSQPVPQSAPAPTTTAASVPMPAPTPTSAAGH